MANDHNTIYLVNFEGYLKPKAPSKPILLPPSQSAEVVPEKSSFEMFCETTSIHGISMLILTRNASTCERVTWKILILFSVFIAAAIFLKSLQISAGTPTLTYIESTHDPAYMIPFPAVTLCSLNRMSKRSGLKLAQKFALTTDQDVKQILRLFTIPLYPTENINASPEGYQKFDEMLSMNNYSLRQFFDEVLTDCMSNLLRCIWKGRTVACDTLFEVVSTTIGRCCSFNYYARTINRTKKSIQSLSPTKPRRVNGVGYENGLTVLIDPAADDYMAGFLKAPGYRAIIHDAYDYPEDNSINKFLSTQSETYIAVKAEVTYGTKYLRNMGFLKRGCTFDPEHMLKYFQEYSVWNCLAECLSFRVLNKCGCAAHHMVNFPGQELCNMTQMDCINQENEIFQGLVETTGILATPVCGCMPECSFNKYYSKTSSGRLNRTFAKGQHRFFNNITITDQMLVHIFFADLTAPIYRIDAFDSWQSVVGTAGGITGLTLGFSIVSLVEILFFVCVRPLYAECVKLATRFKAHVYAAR